MTIDPAPEFDNGQLAILEHSESAVISEYLCKDAYLFIRSSTCCQSLFLSNCSIQSLNLLLIPRTEVYKHPSPQTHSQNFHNLICHCSCGCKCSGVGFDYRMAVFQSLSVDMVLAHPLELVYIDLAAVVRIEQFEDELHLLVSWTVIKVMSAKLQVSNHVNVHDVYVCVCNFSKCQIQRYLSICHKVQDIFWENQSKSDEKKKTWNSKPVKTIRV